LTVPLVDLRVEHDEVAEEVRRGWARVIDRTAFILGEEGKAFESELAAFSGVRHCVGVANGTDAVEIALRACCIGPGDEVIVPANSFVASALAVLRAGAIPVLADVDSETLLIDADHAARHTGPRTRAIMPVHLHGHLAPVSELGRLADEVGAFLVEDAAQAHGAARGDTKVGAAGAMTATSFYPAKNLGAYGDAGAVLTGSDELARRARALRNYGSDARHEHNEQGFNSRLDELQAVVLRAKLRRLARWNQARRAAATRYDRLLADLEKVRRPSGADVEGSVWHLYVVRVPDRDKVLARLNEAGIGAGVHYRTPIHLQGFAGSLGYKKGDFPVAEAACKEILSLPVFPRITLEQQERVVDELDRALR
jgi:dTDP-4-amino-4,6-dideoxygalactose transaminase